MRTWPAMPPPGGMRLEKGFSDGSAGRISSNTIRERRKSRGGGSAGWQGRRLFCASSSKAEGDGDEEKDVASSIEGGLDADIDAEKCKKERASSKGKSTRKKKKKKSSTKTQATTNSESGGLDAGSSTSGDSDGDGSDAVGGADDGHSGSDKGGKGKKKKTPWVPHRGKTPFGKPFSLKEKQLSQEDLNKGGWEDEGEWMKGGDTYAGGGYGGTMTVRKEFICLCFLRESPLVALILHSLRHPDGNKI